MTITLNIDAAELDDEPEALASLAHMLNVACGAHAGDARMASTVIARAARSGASVGAHPSFPDRAGFGRAPMNLSDDALRATLREQLQWLAAIARDAGVALTHVKPHGALYHTANSAPAVARAVVEVARAELGDVAVVGPPAGALEAVARSLGTRFLREGFADRAYLPDGSLVARGAPGATLDDLDAVRAQVESLVRSGRFETLCVHGDGARAVEVARVVRGALR